MESDSITSSDEVAEVKRRTGETKDWNGEDEGNENEGGRRRGGGWADGRMGGWMAGWMDGRRWLAAQSARSPGPLEVGSVCR